MSQVKSRFLEDPESYQNKDLTVLVMGAGHVGLTHACYYAQSGLRVLVSDRNDHIMSRVSRGESPFHEPMVDELLRNYVDRNLFVTRNLPEAVAQSNVVSVSVGTPLNALEEPDVAAIFNVCMNISDHVKEGALLMITSTVPVGTTNRLREELERRRIAIGEKLGLAYCPERMVTGQGIRTIREFPRIVSGVDPKSLRAAKRFFENIGVRVVLVSRPEVAEMSKLLCNAHRAINIAVANELALACSAYGLDSTEVFRAANTSPLVNIMRPGVMGGSCLTKDPDFLVSGAVQKGLVLSVSMAARELNKKIPVHIVRLVKEGLDRASREISGSKIAVLGLAFKGETSDIRETPALRIISLLGAMGCSNICVYDPYVSEEDARSTGARFDLVRDIEAAISESSCIILATEHREIVNADFAKLCRLALQPPIIIDAKGIISTKIENAILGGIGLPLTEPRRVAGVSRSNCSFRDKLS